MGSSARDTMALPMVRCEPYRARILESACVARYRAGKAEHCRGCPVGAERAGDKPPKAPETLFEAVCMALEAAQPYRVQARFFSGFGSTAAIHLIGIPRGYVPSPNRRGNMITKTAGKKCKSCGERFAAVDPGYHYCMECSSPKWNVKQAVSAACRMLRFFGFEVETTDTPRGVGILVRGRPRDPRPRSGEKR